jgi:cytochrome P450
MIDIMEPYIGSHQKSLDPENIRDFLDTMLIETKNCTNPDSCFGPKLGFSTIVNSMMDLFMAGMETTSSSLLHLFLQLFHHPEVQEKAHRELDLVRITKRGRGLFSADIYIFHFHCQTPLKYKILKENTPIAS